MNQTQVLLLAARTLISYEEEWTQFSYGRSADGKATDSLDERACRWCVFGALFAVDEEAEFKVSNTSERFLNRAAIELFGQSAVIVNDQKGHACVMKLYDKAIELAS